MPLLLLDIICFLLVFAVLVRCCYCIFCVIPLLRFAKKGTSNAQSNKEVVLPPISVIICSKNEAVNLKQYLPQVLSQQYPHFEVVVVNDASTDETLNVLSDFQKKHAHLKVVTILQAEKTTMGGKRQALQRGIEQAQHNYLLLTDADCYPSSNRWIELMAKHFANGKQIVLGYGPYFSEKGWLNKVVGYETLHTALRYLSCALAGMPYMGVGRNLAYTKQLFYESGGFDGQSHLTSGDDDLLVNKAATAKNTAIEVHRDAFCYSPPPANWSAWYRQKARHLGAGKTLFYSTLTGFGWINDGRCLVLWYDNCIPFCWTCPKTFNRALFFLNTSELYGVCRSNSCVQPERTVLVYPFVRFYLSDLLFSVRPLYTHS